MSDLWTTASGGVEEERSTAALASALAATAEYRDFLSVAASKAEFDNRMSLVAVQVQSALSVVAHEQGVDPAALRVAWEATLKTAGGLDGFWEEIDAQIEALKSAKSADDVMRICPPQGGLSDPGAQGFFAGSGGDATVWEALDEAGWTTVDHEASYYWAMKAPNGDIVSYVEGDLYRGNQLVKGGSRKQAKTDPKLVVSDDGTFSMTVRGETWTAEDGTSSWDSKADARRAWERQTGSEVEWTTMDGYASRKQADKNKARVWKDGDKWSWEVYDNRTQNTSASGVADSEDAAQADADSALKTGSRKQAGSFNPGDDLEAAQDQVAEAAEEAVTEWARGLKMSREQAERILEGDDYAGDVYNTSAEFGDAWDAFTGELNASGRDMESLRLDWINAWELAVDDAVLRMAQNIGGLLASPTATRKVAGEGRGWAVEYHTPLAAGATGGTYQGADAAFNQQDAESKGAEWVSQAPSGSWANVTTDSGSGGRWTVSVVEPGGVTPMGHGTFASRRRTAGEGDGPEQTADSGLGESGLDDVETLDALQVLDPLNEFPEEKVAQRRKVAGSSDYDRGYAEAISGQFPAERQSEDYYDGYADGQSDFDANGGYEADKAKTSTHKVAGNPYAVGTPNWFDWEAGGGDPASHGPVSGVPRDLFPEGGVPLRGDLTPEQEKWMRSRGSRRTAGDGAYGGDGFKPNYRWNYHLGRGLQGFPGSEIIAIIPGADYLMNGPMGSEAHGVVVVRTEDGRELRIPKDIARITSYERTASRKTAFYTVNEIATGSDRPWAVYDGPPTSGKFVQSFDTEADAEAYVESVGGTRGRPDPVTARMLAQVYDALSPENQAKFAAMPRKQAVEVARKTIERAKASRKTASGDMGTSWNPLSVDLDLYLNSLAEVARQADAAQPGRSRGLGSIVTALRLAASDGYETEVVAFARGMYAKAISAPGNADQLVSDAAAGSAVGYLIDNRPAWIDQYLQMGPATARRRTAENGAQRNHLRCYVHPDRPGVGSYVHDTGYGQGVWWPMCEECKNADSTDLSLGEMGDPVTARRRTASEFVNYPYGDFTEGGPGDYGPDERMTHQVNDLTAADFPHVHPETYEASDPDDYRKHAIHYNKDQCAMSWCTYAVYTDEGKAKARADAAADPMTKKSSRRRTAMPNPVDLNVKVGDIFSSNWGYDQTNIDFYEVVALTAQSVRVRKVSKRIVGNTGYAEDVVPNQGDYIGEPMIRRIQPGWGSEGKPGFSVPPKAWASLWDGKPESQTALGWGR